MREFFAVTLPGLRHELAFALILTMIGALRTFDINYLLTKGGPGTSTTVPAFEVYKNAFIAGRGRARRRVRDRAHPRDRHRRRLHSRGAREAAMNSRPQAAINHFILALFGFVALYPLINLFFVAINDSRSIQTGLGWPDRPRPANFVDAWNQAGFGSGFVGSFVIASSVVAAATVLSTLAGYAFGTMRFRGRDVLFYVFVIGLIIPMESIVSRSTTTCVTSTSSTRTGA